MTFSEKLDFLMRLTNTKNSALARSVSLDPSHISRLRRGERSLPKQENFSAQISAYLAKKCGADYQKKALSDAMKKEEVLLCTEEEAFTRLILDWFAKDDNISPVSSLLTDFGRLSTAPQKKTEEAGGCVTVFYGHEGMRQATIALLNLMLAKKSPPHLLIYSDEDSEWMMENPAFYDAWIALLNQLILRGSRIKIVHKISRDIHEMLTVIRQWLPFYMTGAVDPYYYPKLRDGVYKRMLTVAPGAGAIITTSVGEVTEATANLMMTERKTVDSFTNEFYSYLSLCKPLIRIKNAENMADVRGAEVTLVGVEAASISSFSGLPYLFSLSADSEEMQTFVSRLALYPTCHVVRLQEDMPKAQLLAMAQLLRDYPLYRVLLRPDGDALPYTILATEEKGVRIISQNVPAVIFDISEATMSLAFWNFMQELVAQIERREETIQTILDFAAHSLEENQ